MKKTLSTAFLILGSTVFSLAFPSSISAQTGDPACVRAGCSGELCVPFGQQRSTSCVFKPEFACYQQANCEMNTAGQCAFTMTAQVQACLDQALSSPVPSPSPTSIPSPSPIPPGSIDWVSAYAELISPSFVIETPNGSFNATSGDINVHSDPGNPSYTTLEATWNEQGVEMRMFIYFAAQNGKWRVTEFRTYDGRARGDWIFYDGTAFGEQSLGQAFTANNLVISSRDNRGRVRFGSVKLQGFLNYQSASGDLNADGKVNLLDYSILVSDLFKTGANLSADINGDGKVNLLDYSILVNNLRT
jgi:hypothetical protein